MRRILLASAAVCAVLSATVGFAQQSQTFRYPRVYSPTGSLYGPTQAHYQYQRQYGQPWHGYNGLTATVPNPQIGFRAGYGHSPWWSGYGCVGGYSHFHLNVGPSFSAPGYARYSTVYRSIPAAPLVMQGHPQWLGRNPADNQVLRQGRLEEELRWKLPQLLEPDRGKTVRRPPAPSTPEAKLKSIRLQAHGDMWFRQQEYHQAYKKYKAAAEQAQDRAEPQSRLGLTLAALGHHRTAVKYFKRALERDPDWPSTGISLEKLFGPDNQLALSSALHKVTLWVKEDIRDPDRLFLLGLLLHFNEDRDRAGLVFETALRLAGRGDHLKAFLRSPDQVAETQPPAPQTGKAGAAGPAAGGPGLPPLPVPPAPAP